MSLRSGTVGRLKYWLERMLGGGALLQLLLAWGVVVAVAVLGGLLVFVFARSDAGIAEELWWSFLRLTDPGYLGDDEGTSRRIISTLLTVAGYVLFMGTLVAIMTQWLFRQMRQFELGQTPVSFRQHTVILGWTSRSIPVVNELIHPEVPATLVNRIAVLADNITEGPSEEVLAQPWSTKQRRRVVLRSGSLLNPDHLQRVAIQQAQTIIVPSRGNFAEQTLSADADAIKVLLSLQARQLTNLPPRVIIELQDAQKIAIARHTYSGPLEVVASDLLIARILMRSTLYPGLSGAVNALLVDADQPQFIPATAANFVGKKWQQVYASALYVTPCGVLREENGEQYSYLAPPADFILKAGDEILYLAGRVRDIQHRNSSATHKPIATPQLLLTPPRPRQSKVLLLGWNNRVPALLEQFIADQRTEFAVTSVSTSSIDERQRKLQQRWGLNADDEMPLQINWREADYTLEAVLKELKLHQYDAVMLFSSDRLGTGEEADARSIVAFMVLDYLLAQGNPDLRPHIMVELHDPSNEAYVDHSHNEVLVSSVVVSHVLAQVAVYPQLHTVYEQLLSSEGARMGIRYAPPALQRSVTIAELREHALAQQAVLLGYQQPDGRTVMNPPLNEQVNVTANTQLIVLQGAQV
ncbi:hypothetical protein [Aliidiomarina haloalkalitolerans]|uniref:Ion channel DMI1 n=1 Tax=Aliidiomarina haloalkalitolerans TaxID=859059 RepID=A0A432VTS4_9GAMM|nr:hypothetical protein [Aliidiomarina haloalkalitolerans]MCL4409404.1 hypothetical protein [Gammaproteobacteria bacterium]RUO19840.1 hypothetical protein CWE06_07330 [Aliidiomarina haloalkalitolerans]